MNQSQMHYAKQKKSDSKATYDMIPFIWYSENEETTETG